MNIFVSLKFECQSGGQTRDLRLSNQEAATTAPVNNEYILQLIFLTKYAQADTPLFVIRSATPHAIRFLC